MALTVGKLAEQVGVSSDAIRYYERVGILPRVSRAPSGYRSYEDAHVERLRFVKGAQRMGLRLAEIKELLDVADRGLCPCGHTERLVRKRIADMDEEMARLAEVRAQLVHLTERFPSEECPPNASEWPCRTEFVRAGGGDSDDS